VRPALLLIFALFHLFSNAQNLVPNPGFEFYEECPTSIGQIHRATGWYSGNTGTPEYARLRCPFSAFNTHSGEGMAGLILHAQYPKAIEYIGIKLSDTLQTNQRYCIGFHLRAEESLFYIDKIGLAFTEGKYALKEWAPIQLKTAVTSKPGEPIHHMQNWVEVATEYTALGKETHLLLGNFNRPEALTQYMNEFAWGIEPGWNSYYFVDDVFVVPIQVGEACPEKQNTSNLSVPTTPASIAKTADTTTLQVYFDFDADELTKAELAKAEAFFKGRSEAQYVLSGHTDSLGTNSYNLVLSERRVAYIKKLIYSKLNVPDIQIKTHYFGKLKPAVPNDTEKGRALNRRVEIICLPKPLP
jgi:outer membrane protein OmpA-like peptidoglycan-associated protein